VFARLFFSPFLPFPGSLSPVNVLIVLKLTRIWLASGIMSSARDVQRSAKSSRLSVSQFFQLLELTHLGVIRRHLGTTDAQHTKETHKKKRLTFSALCCRIKVVEFDEQIPDSLLPLIVFA
jgi:hypothetical protein